MNIIYSIHLYLHLQALTHLRTTLIYVKVKKMTTSPHFPTASGTGKKKKVIILMILTNEGFAVICHCTLRMFNVVSNKMFPQINAILLFSMQMQMLKVYDI